jgi:chromosome segregation ATPase
MTNIQTQIDEARAALDGLVLEQSTITAEIARAGEAADVDRMIQLEARADELPRRIALQTARMLRLTNERDAARLPELEEQKRQTAEQAARRREIEAKATRERIAADGAAYNASQELSDLKSDMADRARECARLEGQARLPRGSVLRSAMHAA